MTNQYNEQCKAVLLESLRDIAQQIRDEQAARNGHGDMRIALLVGDRESNRRLAIQYGATDGEIAAACS
jgi:hypothetical protein